MVRAPNYKVSGRGLGPSMGKTFVWCARTFEPKSWIFSWMDVFKILMGDDPVKALSDTLQQTETESGIKSFSNITQK